MNGSSLAQLPLSDDPQSALAQAPGGGDSFPVAVFPIPASAEISHDEHPTSRIFVAQQGHGKRWYRQEGRTLELRTAPRMIEMYEAGLRFEHCRWEGSAGRCVLVEFDDANLNEVTHGQLPKLELPTRHQLFDAQVSHLALELADEALQGSPNGRLYQQGLCIALVGVLSSRYSRAARTLETSRVIRLSPTQQQRIVDLIDGQIGNDLGLSSLSREAGLSAYHFARVFKATFGVTPHRYVLDRRLQAAVEALRRDPSRSIADIALWVGFSSQAHMTELMRRHFGVTPGELRRNA
jgi:AraC family transcriptional regulator